METVSTPEIKKSRTNWLAMPVVTAAALAAFLYFLVATGLYDKLTGAKAVSSDAQTGDNTQIEEVQKAASSLNTTIGDYGQRLDDVEKLTNELKEKSAAQDSEQYKLNLAADDVEELKSNSLQTTNRLNELEYKVNNSLNQTHDMHFAMLSSLWTLQYRINFGLPYTTELRALKVFSKNIPEISNDLQPLEAFSESGIKTHADLVTEFDSVAHEIQQIAGTYIPGKSWLEGFIINISNIAIIRKKGDDNAKETPEEVIRNVKANLMNSDLSPAIAELDKLPEAFTPAIEVWKKEAASRLASEDAISTIYERIIDSYENSQFQKNNLKKN